VSWNCYGWLAYWLDDAWTRPGKAHAFPRGFNGHSDRALCGYEPKWNANTMYSEEPRCKRCEVKLAKIMREELG
jgi:hypothetical protein